MKKKRIRSHILGSLGVNFVEKQVLLAGYFFERKFHDYSTDGNILTFNENGEVESGWIYVQVKSTDNPVFSNIHQGYILPLEKGDLEYWLTTKYPFILILYNSQKDEAYYLDLQKYFQENQILLKKINKFKRVFINPKNLFNPTIVEKFRILKNEISRQY